MNRMNRILKRLYHVNPDISLVSPHVDNAPSPQHELGYEDIFFRISRILIFAIL
jgi:hypothetical protein